MQGVCAREMYKEGVPAPQKNAAAGDETDKSFTLTDA